MGDSPECDPPICINIKLAGIVLDWIGFGVEKGDNCSIDFSVGSNGSSVILGQAINLGREAV